MIIKLRQTITLIFLLCINISFAVSDSLVFNGGTALVGEIKKMEKGVLEIDIPYGDENFKIKWQSIKEIYTKSQFLVSADGKVIYGRLESISDGKVKIFDESETYLICNLSDIVYLAQLKDGFDNRFTATLEAGFNLFKARDMQQFSLRSSAGYHEDKWSVNATYNIIRSSQNETESIKRTDGLLDYKRLLFKNWFGILTISTLSNTEQLIDIRANSQLGVGNYIYSSNKAYLILKIGINNNLERFSNIDESFNSWEGSLSTELNLYAVDGLELSFNYMGYSGLTEKGRYRADLNLDLKYDLPLDLFIRAGFVFNYDNQPAINSVQTDYVFRTGIGWEW
ncbi:DUF481 domain-containing protein [Litoribaculum gwangyangense]|uniref:DUF481 domain-containing protein n=1 Tax=Litoribaculum gwangyangense TaxID=1130722 RepID=A0ABP9CLQ2_9FLAO